MSKYEGKVRFFAFLDDTVWFLDEQVFPLKVWCDGFLIRGDTVFPTNEDVLDEEIRNIDLGDLMDDALEQYNELAILTEIVPYHYYEVVGTFWVEWIPSNSYEYDDWDIEYGLDDALIQRIDNKTAREIGLDLAMPTPIQCA